ncbi:Lacal_2735 family protein [Hyunsoonleella flava]|uniref:Lacal_2735 family protein n=1 Tax=Hyunsoonleella flava TaxID=2527939 RepID=A0A4Q9FH09_9FLAO|nr:Lacal_2735 family protein [Hyunsoonleella flava]TBN06753.1 Lacal_2735 family protein [Hyunsoonleella flava]
MKKYKKDDSIQQSQIELIKKYKTLIEQAYNLRQTDAPLSDFSEYKAIKLLNKLNKLGYLTRNHQRPAV